MTKFETYDYAFIGLGAANSLLINMLHREDLLKNKSIIIFEPHEKNINDKSFCYWANSEEVELLGISKLSKVNWGSIQINKSSPQELNDQKYYYVNSLDLYNNTASILKLHNVKYKRNGIQEIHTNIPNSSIIISNGKEVFANHIFDSRPPKWKPLKVNESFLWQSFIGWRIELTSDFEYPQVDTFTMMDFSIEQNNSCQFIYILPFSKNEILIELTRFDQKVITGTEAEPIIKKYINEYLGGSSFNIKEVEMGKIPMCSGNIEQIDHGSNFLSMGSGAGLVKPSTGYAFKSMAYHSLYIAKELKVQKSISPAKEKAIRFKFYDRLLLKILEQKPETGRYIFSTLFNKLPINRVLKFLDEKTTLVEDIGVLKSLPKSIFIKTAIKDFINRISNSLNLLKPTLFALIFLLLEKLGLGSIVQLVLILGLIIIGIPHGAMDHLLYTRNFNTPITILFIFQYLIKGSIMFGIWWLSPILGLLVFLAYSAWHFGQTDSQEWDLTSNRLTQMLLGVWTLITMFSLHLVEFNNTINMLGVSSLIVPQGITGYNIILELSLLTSVYLALNTKFLYIIEILIILIIGSFMPLIYSFGIYFIFIHSLNGWKHIQQNLKSTSKKLTKKALPFSLGAFLIFIIFFGNVFGNWESNIGPFFIFLSCLSFPHVWEMTKFYSKKSLNKF